MREITVTICFRPEDEAFDRLTDDALIETIKNGLLRAYPLLRSTELDVRSGRMFDSGLPDHGDAHLDVARLGGSVPFSER